ncbi:glycosyltransferase [Alicyclobacillus macrosporangiidus]|uniref:glycosyltransferase n=1 Tax=Alicyclobacillus macrosporangiidus TaxID=392015 RepID=UPI000497D24A|nr:glycosyltransferase [Alicyclobacillus macrosporangiidus]
MAVPLCAIVPVRNEADRIGNALAQMHRAGVRRGIIVVNGSRDGSAAAAKKALARLRWEARVIDLKPALGPDVPRAVGTYVAMRTFPDTGWFLHVDGDWGGGFGPMLQEWLARATVSRAQMVFVGRPAVVARMANRRTPPATRPDLWLWHRALRSRWPQWMDVSPAESPWLIHRRAFLDLSPFWLHHPGQWFARCVLASGPDLRLAVVRGWDARLTGNRTRDRLHAERMRETLWGDAIEGYCLLTGRRPTRRWQGVWWDGYHSQRRVDILRRIGASWNLERA